MTKGAIAFTRKSSTVDALFVPAHPLVRPDGYGAAWLLHRRRSEAHFAPVPCRSAQSSALLKRV